MGDMAKLLEKTFIKKMILLSACAQFVLPMSSHSMEIIFDKTYNISRKANITTLNWRTVSFEKLSGNRVKYKLVAEHPEGKSIEYLSNVDSVVSEDIKKRLIRKFDITTSKIEFKDGAAHFELELPYDFETRYLPIKLVKNNGHEDYVVRFRFGDYRFMVANKLINDSVKKDISNIAAKDPNDLYQVRRQGKRRVIIRKQEESRVVSVDEIYAEERPDATSVASETVGGSEGLQRKQASTPSEDTSLFSQFESLAHQYGTEAVDPSTVTTSVDEMLSEKQEDSSLAETLPEKIVPESEVNSLIGIDNMTLDAEDEPAEELSFIEMNSAENSEVVESEVKLEEPAEAVAESSQAETQDDTPGWITKDEEPQLVEQKIDKVDEPVSYDDYEGTLFQKFEAASSKYDEQQQQIRKESEEFLRSEQALAETHESESVAAPSDLADELQEKLAEQEEAAKEESKPEFLVYEAAEALDEEDFITQTPAPSTEVASVTAPSVKEEYSKIPDDGSIPWLEEGTTSDAILNTSGQAPRDLSSVEESSVYEVKPPEWVFSFSKGFTFTSTLSKEETSPEERQPSSNKERSFEDYESGVSFESEELGLDFKKKD